MKATSNARRPAKSKVTFPAAALAGCAVTIQGAAVRVFAIALLLSWILPAAAGPDLDRPLTLVARPGMSDRLYGNAVLVVTPTGGGRHVGFIVNRPSNVTVAKLFPDDAPSQKVLDPVYVGGPLQPSAMFALVGAQANPGGNSLEFMPGLYVAYEAAVIDRIIKSGAPRARFVAGLVAWQAGELQAEIDIGAWLVVDAEAELALRQPDGLWDELVWRWQHRSNSI